MGSQKKGKNNMPTDKFKAVVLKFVDKVQNQHDIGGLDELFSPDFVDHSGLSNQANLDGTRQFFTMLFTAFPDIKVIIHDQVSMRTYLPVKASDPLAVRVDRKYSLIG
jgi:hypothetical protein